MSGYLKIENVGSCAPELFTLLGSSTKRDNVHEDTVGNFGSGAKHSLVVCLRNNLSPVIFCNNLRMDFSVREQELDNKTFNRVQVCYSGKDNLGKTKKSTEDLGFVLEYGVSDWGDVALALREYVSNALDKSLEENPNGYISRVIIEPVGEHQVRAKSGCTRVFIPLTEEVLKFYSNLGKWFLHFSEPELLHQSVLPKKNRSLDNSNNAVIYKKGVRVREVKSYECKESLFDYNLAELKLDESRQVDDYAVKREAARQLGKASLSELITLYKSFTNPNDKKWEREFYNADLGKQWSESDEVFNERSKRFKLAFDKAFPDETVLCHPSDAIDFVQKKGYTPVVVPNDWFKVCQAFGVMCSSNVLNESERKGISGVPADDVLLAEVKKIWKVLDELKLTNGKEFPNVFTFNKVVSGEGNLFGFCNSSGIYINDSLSGKSVELTQTILEELSHHITGATDNSRDFQEYAFNVATRLIGFII